MKLCDPEEKVKIRNSYIPIRVAKIQTLTTPNADEAGEQQELQFISGHTAAWEEGLEVFTKQHVVLSHNPAIMLLGFCLFVCFGF